MIYVKQIYAHWVGVKNETHCTNGITTFALDNARRKQLKEITPSRYEIKTLLDDYCKRNAGDPYGFKEFLKKELEKC